MKFNKIAAILVFFILTLCFCACDRQSYLSSGEVTVSGETSETVSPADDQDEDSVIFVQVAGAVKSPGVFQLPTDSRVIHAIEAAGGLKRCADDRSINLAERISDGQKITVFTKKESVSLSDAENTQEGESGSGLVNINTSDRDRLMTLPGIGQTKADAIIAYRQEQGSFSAIEDLKNVTGIGEGVYSKLSGLICT